MRGVHANAAASTSLLQRLYRSFDRQFERVRHLKFTNTIGTPVLLQLYLLYYGLAPILKLNALPQCGGHWRYSGKNWSTSP